MRETKHKVQRVYSLDYDIASAFDNFCPPGERSNTLNELLKDYLESHKRINVNKRDVLSSLELELQTQAEKVESLRAELERESKEKEEARLVEAARLEALNFSSELNEECKAKARVLVEAELGLSRGSTVPSDLHEKFVNLWRKRTQELIQKKLKEVKE